jgi:hypothetical protein
MRPASKTGKPSPGASGGGNVDNDGVYDRSRSGARPPQAAPPPPPMAVVTATPAPMQEKTVAKPTSKKMSPAADDSKNEDKQQVATDEQQKQEATKEATTLAWAKEQHARVTALVRAGNCVDAGPIAASIASAAPDYYAQFVATDRAIQQCKPYINDAKDKEAAHASKSRAKVVSPSEAQPSKAADDMK